METVASVVGVKIRRLNQSNAAVSADSFISTLC